MKINVCKALQGAGWSLLTAGLLGWSAPASAQVFNTADRSPAGTPAPTSSAGAQTRISYTKPAGSSVIQVAHRPEAARALLGNPYVTTGFIRQELPTKATGNAYVTSGTIKFESDSKGTPLSSSARAPATQARLKQRIEQVCGRTASDIQVASDAPNRLSIHLKVRNFNDGEKVTRQLGQLPELQSYQVAFNLEVAQ